MDQKRERESKNAPCNLSSQVHYGVRPRRKMMNREKQDMTWKVFLVIIV